MTDSMAAGFDFSLRSHVLTSFPMIGAGRGALRQTPGEVPGSSWMNMRGM